MKRLGAALLPFCLTACMSTDVDRYRAERPELDLRDYLNGTLDAWGMFQGRSGEVTKRFHVLIEARWSGDTGVLDEQFSWSDGTSSRREWTLIRQPDGSFRGRADDVIGEAVGEVAGNALRWRYVLALPVDDKVYHVDFDDWMFLMDDRVMLNRSYMSKWGFRLGEVSLTFVKRPPQP
ncbi:MAG TPA: DUF3833 domain-containing protein [Aromatoleum sp.]|uniref:DUF3833 domain-containing protein n=1 Tax=Aromatoleum sp. TaxID=2307007 RepID=UPI002B48B45A|nr:DUF3833 domain-containing protein [Aromatoleum sp.]HJV25148.1 DUF3833 domain-containing protein [Aromatoleum sp.]